jgi:hypothetical protein
VLRALRVHGVHCLDGIHFTALKLAKLIIDL